MTIQAARKITDELACKRMFANTLNKPNSKQLQSRTVFTKACVSLLRPLARIMLRHGLSSYDFARVANIAFVQAARDILNEQGSPVSFSRISTITGLHRHVVSDIVNLERGQPGDLSEDKDYQRNRLARVLAGWFESPEYTDSEGRPRVLAAEGPAPTFETLVRSFSGDIYPAIILDELLRVGAVRRLKDGSLRAISRRYTLGGADAAAIEHMGSVARDVLSTLERNISSPPESRLYEDSVVSVALDRSSLPLLRRLLRERGAAFLEDIEGWVAEHEKRDAAQPVRAGVIVQMVLDDAPDRAGVSPTARKP